MFHRSNLPKIGPLPALAVVGMTITEIFAALRASFLASSRDLNYADLRHPQTMSLAVSHRITGQPTNTGIQQVSIRYSSTDGTLTAAGTPNAARPPISAASTAPTPPGVGAAEANVPPTMVTTVTATKVVPPPKASTLAHNASAAPRVVPAQPSRISASRRGSRASLTRSDTTSF